MEQRRSEELRRLEWTPGIEPELWMKRKPSLCGWRKKNPKRSASESTAPSLRIVPPPTAGADGRTSNPELSRLTLERENGIITNERTQTT